MNFTWAGYVGLISAAALSSSESLVIKPTRSAIGGGTVTFIYCSMSGGGGTAIYGLYRYICCSEGYGFQAVTSGIGHINQRVWV